MAKEDYNQIIDLLLVERSDYVVFSDIIRVICCLKVYLWFFVGKGGRLDITF